MKIKRLLRTWLFARVRIVLVKLLIAIIQQEKLMALQDDCKHENQTGVYCGLCGKALKDPDEEQVRGMIRGEIRSALEDAGILKKPAQQQQQQQQQRGNLKDKIFKKTGK